MQLFVAAMMASLSEEVAAKDREIASEHVADREGHAVGSGSAKNGRAGGKHHLQRREGHTVRPPMRVSGRGTAVLC
jgi:hypothetical protein